MEYVSPDTLDEVFRALEAEDARCLAGGQSLVAMMNLGLVAPARLVSLRRVAGLHGIAMQPDGGVRIGAMTTHAELAALRATAPGPALLAQAARVVAYPAVRAQGTIGGSVAHADPAADYPVALTAADASVEVASRSGSSRIRAREFFLGLFETALKPGQIVTAIHVPAGPAGGRSKYEKLSLVAGDFAILAVAAIVTRSAEVAIGGCGTTPVHLHAPDLSDGALLAAARDLAEHSDPPSDHRASAEYRRRVLPELMLRTIRAAEVM